MLGSVDFLLKEAAAADGDRSSAKSKWEGLLGRVHCSTGGPTLGHCHSWRLNEDDSLLNWEGMQVAVKVKYYMPTMCNVRHVLSIKVMNLVTNALKQELLKTSALFTVLRLTWP